MTDDGYLDLVSAINSAMINCENMMDEDTPKAAPKRKALVPIDENRAFKNLFFIKDTTWGPPSVEPSACQLPPSQPVSFQIFQDSENTREVLPPPLKEKKLPLYLRKLYKEEVIEDSKENEYWAARDFDEAVDERKKTEDKWAAPFWNSIHSHLKKQENKFPQNGKEICTQAEIDSETRTILMDWIVEVGVEYKLHEETVHLAAAHVDRCIQLLPVTRSQLQLLGTSALFIACKQLEVYPPELKEFVYITNDTYTKRDILRMEQSILKLLKFQILFPTASTFLEMYIHTVESSMSEIAIHLSHYICDISLVYIEALDFLPSKVGATCLAIARRLSIEVKKNNQRDEVWPLELVNRSGYSITNIKSAFEVIYQLLVRVCNEKVKSAVYKKYLDVQFGEVAKIQVPNVLRI